MRITRRGELVIAVLFAIVVAVLFAIVAGRGSSKPIHHSPCYINGTCGESNDGDPIHYG